MVKSGAALSRKKGQDGAPKFLVVEANSRSFDSGGKAASAQDDKEQLSVGGGQLSEKHIPRASEAEARGMTTVEEW